MGFRIGTIDILQIGPLLRKGRFGAKLNFNPLHTGNFAITFS